MGEQSDSSCGVCKENAKKSEATQASQAETEEMIKFIMTEYAEVLRRLAEYEEKEKS